VGFTLCSDITLGTLNIKIPWTGLLSQPLEVVLRDVFLLVVPKPTDNYDPEKEEERSLKKKLKIVEKIEASASSNADDSGKHLRNLWQVLKIQNE